jgi:predicted DNA-binding transcriptional regulator YafY
VPRSQIRYLREPRVIEDGDPATVVASFEGLDQAYHGLLAYGPQAEVLAPSELRARVARAAAETAAIYAT